MAPFQIRPTRVASGYAINTQFPCDRGKPNRPQYGSFEDWVSALIQRALAEQDDRLHEVLIVGAYAGYLKVFSLVPCQIHNYQIDEAKERRSLRYVAEGNFLVQYQHHLTWQGT